MNISTLFILSLIPLIAANLWHSVLLLLARESNVKFQSISEAASSKAPWLVAHRAAHIGCSIFLSTFALFFLWPNGHSLLFWILILGAISDVIEVCVLNKKTASVHKINQHSISAWVMAISYLAYSIIASQLVGLNSLPIIVVIALLLVALFISAKKRFDKFYIVQHLFFMSVATIMACANWLLLNQ